MSSFCCGDPEIKHLSHKREVGVIDLLFSAGPAATGLLIFKFYSRSLCLFLIPLSDQTLLMLSLIIATNRGSSGAWS